MQAGTEVLEQLIESALWAITQPSSDQADVAIQQAKAAAEVATTDVLRHGEGLHQPSFNLGVATTIIRALDNTMQNRRLSDLRAVARASSSASSSLPTCGARRRTRASECWDRPLNWQGAKGPLPRASSDGPQ